MTALVIAAVSNNVLHAGVGSFAENMAHEQEARNDHDDRWQNDKELKHTTSRSTPSNGIEGSGQRSGGAPTRSPFASCR